LGVRLWGAGPYERETKRGAEIKASKMYEVHPNDLIINRIWVRRGSSGIVSNDLAGCVVTTDFPTFEIDHSQVTPEWLTYMFKAKWFWDECEHKSRGTSGRQRINPEEYLDIEIPLPSLIEQQRLVSMIHSVNDRLEIIESLERGTEEAIFALLNSAYLRISNGAEVCLISEIAPLVRRQVDIEADKEYPELGIRSFGKGTFHKPAITGADLGNKRIYQIEADDLMFTMKWTPPR
jgi:type I restriction enzyme, S subunit